MPGVDRAQSEFIRKVNDLPVFEVTVRIRTKSKQGGGAGSGASDESSSPVGDWMAFTGSSTGPSSGHVTAAASMALSNASGINNGQFVVGPEVDCELEISVRLVRGNPEANANSPLYHKPKTANYWLILGTGADELLSLKKMGAPRKSDAGASAMTSTINFLTPQSEGEELLVVQLVSDALMGLDVVVDIPMTISTSW
jgi:hypothetical protein